MDKEKVFSMSISKVFPLLIAKAERKGRTREEVNEIICWMTGYTDEQLTQQLEYGISYEKFFAEAPQMNPACNLIKGSICGIKVESIEDPLMQKIRWLDKMVDELAKGKPMEKILRKEQAPAMWKCPKCGREFKKKGQSHYCGEKPKTIEEYIAVQREDIQEELRTMQRILHDALPEAEERISWSMPTFWKDHNILHFSAAKQHIGFYPGPAAIIHFEEELKCYSTNKGTIRIPYGKIDRELVTKIAQWCYETGNHA